MINEGRSFSKKVAAYFFRRFFVERIFRWLSAMLVVAVVGTYAEFLEITIFIATTQPELGGAMSTTWLADAQGLRWPGLWLYEHGSAERLFHSLKTALDQERFESVEGGGRDG